MAAATKQVRVTQVKSGHGHLKNQQGTLVGLGLGKIRRSKVLEDTPSVRGMIRTVQHLVVAEEVK